MKQLRCVECSAEVPIGPEFTGCPVCIQEGRRSALELAIDESRGADLVTQASSHSLRTGVWAYRSLLPLGNSNAPVTLGEGNTPLCTVSSVSSLVGLSQLYFKNESANPTWSYKDRSNTVAISIAKEMGFKKVVAVSTGNHGVSAAAYSAAAGLECVVLCHEDISPTLVRLIHLYGAKAIIGQNRDSFLAALVQQGDWFPAVTVAPILDVCSPYGVEGFKTIAYELFEQLSRTTPDCVFVPVGSGDGFYGIWKGFRDLRSLGLTQSAPRMYACQAEGCNPLVRSYRAGSLEVETLDQYHTMALSIREPKCSSLALRAVYDSKGEAVDCSESEIENVWKMLGEVGLFVEPASAVAVACAHKLARAGRIREHDRVVCILTGAGIKWPEFLAAHSTLPPISGADVTRIVSVTRESV
jgi:threonine synthase